MYCINCGVKLADGEGVCPLCNTAVFHPDIKQKKGEAIFPEDKYPQTQKQSKLLQIILSFLFMIPITTVLICDLQLNKGVTWSGYVMGGLIMAYVFAILPSWFKKPNPVIFVPVSFATICVYLLYIDLATQGGWFLSFAFPVTAGIGIIITAIVTLCRYLEHGKLYIFGGGAMVFGGFLLLTEFLMSFTFGFINFIGWSFYPLATLFLLGALLIFLAIYRPARETMERKFFI